MLETLKTHASNVLGWRTDKRIVVIESDDWGAVRTPNRQTLDALKASRSGIRVNRFDEFDCLERGEDLEALADVLDSVHDSHGSSAVLTTNMVLENPDFEKIQASDYARYASRSLFESYEHTYGTDLRPLWKALQSSRLVNPQFHAREHLNVSLWMTDLQSALPATREAFALGCYGQMQPTGSPYHSHYLAAYHATSQQDLEEKRSRLLDGIALFEQSFGTATDTLIPCNYVWPDELTPVAARAGVKGLQGSRVVHVPDVHAGGTLRRRRRTFRRDSASAPAQLLRNVTFEPYTNREADHVGQALQQVAAAFTWRKPAIISSHRINYVGGLDLGHRDRNLGYLRQLLTAIVKRWPDAAFLSSSDVLDLMTSRPKPGTRRAR